MICATKRGLTGPISERAVSSRLFSRGDVEGSTGGALMSVERRILRGFQLVVTEEEIAEEMSHNASRSMRKK